MTSPAAVLRRRRAIARYADRRHANDRLRSVGGDLRRAAQPMLDAGRPDLAQPYLDEAELFESAAQPLPSL